MKQIFASFFAVLFGAFLAQAADDHITYEGKEGPGKGKHIVLLSGDEEYRSEEGLPMLAKILGQRHGFKCTVLFSLNDKGEIDPTNQKAFPIRRHWTARMPSSCYCGSAPGLMRCTNTLMMPATEASR